MTPDKIIKEQLDYSGITAWHEAGITGEGVVIWNAETNTREHGRISERRIKDAAPGATVISAEQFMRYDNERIIEESVTYQGKKYSTEEFIKAFNIKVVNKSKSGSKTLGVLSPFWKRLRDTYGLILCNAVGNEGEGDWGGAIPYDCAIYVGAASLFKGKPKRDYYSSVTNELDFMQFTGTWSGTSFSSPCLAGMAALLAQVKPTIMQEEAYDYFVSHAEDMQIDGPDEYTGYGLAKMGSIGEDWEENEVITKTKVKVNGKVVEVNRILKNGENYIRLRDLETPLGICKVDYDAKAKMPIIED